MATPNLVQRVVRKSSDFNMDGSIDDNYRMEYMGSSEFECGALPASLKEVCKNLNDYTVSQVLSIHDAHEQPLRVLSLKDDEEYLVALGRLWRDEHSLPTQECVGLMDAKKPKEERLYRADIWWDLEHHVFFCFGKTNMKQLLVALENTQQKFKAAGRI